MVQISNKFHTHTLPHQETVQLQKNLRRKRFRLYFYTSFAVVDINIEIFSAPEF